MSDRDTANGVLGLVQAYVNTVDLQDGPDELTDPNTLKGWLVGRDLVNTGAEVRESDLKHALALREAIRRVIGASSGGSVYPVDVATLNEAATASRLRPRFGPDGKARLEPEVGGVVGAMGRIVAAVFASMAEPEWGRLKLCSSPSCRWAFYDRSRNHSSRWCTMASCGNREKARRFRAHTKHA
jgi:predicted RNA-binding Zn ribbon-like protein